MPGLNEVVWWHHFIEDSICCPKYVCAAEANISGQCLLRINSFVQHEQKCRLRVRFAELVSICLLVLRFEVLFSIQIVY